MRLSAFDGSPHPPPYGEGAYHERVAIEPGRSEPERVAGGLRWRHFALGGIEAEGW